MSKTVLFFPGQASQYVGMGKDLYEHSADVRAMYQFASDIMKVDIAKLSFEGPAEELKRTAITQPAILLHSLAVLTILRNDLPTFDFAAGHSLGEYGALAVAGAFTYHDAIKAVIRRAALMEDACQKNPSTMAAIMGITLEKLEEVCRAASAKGVVVSANINSPAQLVISGSKEGIAEAIRLAQEAGAKRAIPLEVGGAFHSPLMESARSGMAEFLSSATIANPRVPVIANVTAEPVSDQSTIRRLLVEQITAPVRWMQTMTWLAEHGVTRIIEIGPGKVLTGLAKREMKPETMTNLDTLADIQTFTPVSA